MKSWQIIVSGLLPYIVAMTVLLSLLHPRHSDFLTLSFMPLLYIWAIPIYFFTILPWYVVIYFARRMYGERGLYIIGMVMFVVQCIACRFVLGATLTDIRFWQFTAPILGSGVLVFMLCVKLFYKEGTLVEIND